LKISVIAPINKCVQAFIFFKTIEWFMQINYKTTNRKWKENKYVRSNKQTKGITRAFDVVLLLFTRFQIPLHLATLTLTSNNNKHTHTLSKINNKQQAKTSGARSLMLSLARSLSHSLSVCYSQTFIHNLLSPRAKERIKRNARQNVTNICWCFFYT